MKKYIALLLALVFAVALFSGCGSTTAATTEQPAASGTTQSGSAPAAASTESSAPKFKVAYIDFPIADASTQAMYNNAATVVEAAGGEMVFVEGGSDADETITAIESAISAGVAGLMFTPSADSMLPTVAKLCGDAGVYFALTFRSINDPEVKAIVEACPYYAGNTVENEYDAGYYVANLMAEKGIKKVAFISIQKGDTTAEAREAGMRDAFAKAGVEVVGELRSPAQASDAAAAAESWMATIDGLDGIMMLSCQTPGVFEALEDAIVSNNKVGKVFLGSCDFGTDMESSFNNGIAVAMCGGHAMPDRALCSVIVTNAIVGTPLDGGKPVTVVCPFLYLETAEDAKLFQDLALSGDPLYHIDECQELLLGTGIAKVQEVADSYSMADLAARHGA